ncbi:MAG: barstar family protein [Rhodospirillaceae bacterium]|nr:barstar family protein [Rhodospirillaceae bacterium]
MTARSKRRRAVIPADCATIDRAYDLLAKGLALPAHFGRNLDALHDALTGDLAGPFEIVVENAEAFEAAAGAKGKALLKTLRDVAKARKDATITVK